MILNNFHFHPFPSFHCVRAVLTPEALKDAICWSKLYQTLVFMCYFVLYNYQQLSSLSWKGAFCYQCSYFQWVPKQYRSNILIKLDLLTNDYGQTNIEFYNYYYPQFFFNLVKRQELTILVHYHSYCLDLNIIYIIDLSCTRNYDSIFCKREVLELFP